MTPLLALKGIAASENTATPLRERYQDHFLIGFATDRIPFEVEGLLAKHFNVVTAENALKWANVHPYEGIYAFQRADQLIEFAKQHEMEVIGHTLVWHNQTPAWVFQDANGGPIDREALLERMHDHISTVVGRYCGTIKGWDVVNEAFEDDGSLRRTKWLDIIGEDYIEKAFRWAHEACPEAELYYNDYNLTNPAKRAAVIRLIRDLQEKGVPIHGVGEQAHYDTYSPSINEVRRTIEELSTLNIPVLITELDLSVYRWTERRNLYADELDPEVEADQTRRFSQLFNLFREYSDRIGRVTFWGTTDRYSWKNNFPVQGRTDYPLLFDRSGKKKPAFWAVHNFDDETAESH